MSEAEYRHGGGKVVPEPLTAERLAEMKTRATGAEHEEGACGDEYDCVLYRVISNLAEDSGTLMAEVERLKERKEYFEAISLNQSEAMTHLNNETSELRRLYLRANAKLAAIRKAAAPIINDLKRYKKPLGPEPGFSVNADLLRALAEAIKDGPAQ